MQLRNTKRRTHRSDLDYILGKLAGLATLPLHFGPTAPNRRTTGYSAFELIYGRECLLPVQLAVESWNLVEWDNVKSHEDLIIVRMRQLDERITMEDIAARNLRRIRTQNKAYFDAAARLRPEDHEIHPSDLVLIFRPAML